MKNYEFPLWVSLINWYLQHRRNKRGKEQPWCSHGMWLQLLRGLRSAAPVPNGWLEVWLIRMLLGWIDEQERFVTEIIRTEQVKQDIADIHPAWRELFRRVPNIKLTKGF